jgi:uncharacterized protein (TIGR02271 family)
MDPTRHAPERAEHERPPGTAEPPERERNVIAVVREDVQIDKHVRETGRVVVHVEPHVKQQVIDVPLIEQDVQVERVPVNRQVDAPASPRQEGDVTIVPVYEEILVVEKRLVLKEEIRITRRQSTRHEFREVATRSEEVHVVRSESSPD